MATRENSNKLPLGEVSINMMKEGIMHKFPAFSEKSVVKRIFTKYKPLYFENGRVPTDHALVKEWIVETEHFKNDLIWMLKLDYHRFWSYICYSDFIASLNSFLQEAIPSYLSVHELTESKQIITLYEEVLNNVLVIICKIITNKESESNWMPREFLAGLLYDKFIISSPMVLDIFVAYGRHNSTIMKKFFDTLLNVEPKYEKDIKLTIQFMQQTCQQLEKEDNYLKNEEAQIKDLALFLLDISFNIGILVELSPNSITEACIDFKLPRTISSIYENLIPQLYSTLYAFNADNSLLHLNRARTELLKTFNKILNSRVEMMLSKTKTMQKNSEQYLGILIESAGDNIFITDFQKLYPIENDLDILQQAYQKIDTVKLEFVYKAYVEKNQVDNKIKIQSIDCITDDERSSEGDEIYLGACKSDPQHDLETIRAVFPDLSDDFVQKILQRYNVTDAIILLTEGNLPPDLMTLNSSEKIVIPRDEHDDFYINTGIDRLNIFDGDAYDVMTRDAINGVIKKGKGFPGVNSQNKVLNDKSTIKELRLKYLEYSMVSEVVDEDNNMYDDEYDDSYDAMADSESKTTKSLLSTELEDVSDKSESDGEENKSTNIGFANSKDFCENPEKIRARYEKARHTKLNALSGGNKDWRHRDVIGKPKGQGQEKEVMRNRQKKAVNKSQHKQSGADFKRSRGMFPS